MAFFLTYFGLRIALYIPAFILIAKRRGETPLPAIRFSLGVGRYACYSLILFLVGCAVAVTANIWLNAVVIHSYYPDTVIPRVVQFMPLFFLPGGLVFLIFTTLNNLRRLRDLKWPAWLTVPLSIPFFGGFASFFLLTQPGAANGRDASCSTAMAVTMWFAVFAIFMLIMALGCLFGC